MTDIDFLHAEGFARIKAMRRLQTVLRCVKVKNTFRDLHKRCGVGLTNEQFDNIVNTLVLGGWCSLQRPFGATLVVINEQPAPEEAPVETVQ